jgi:hypothetical protein
VGGHGRTGTVLAAIVAEMTEKKDAIQWVRKHYCKKVVESKVQVQFLMKHYGVSEAEPSKDDYVSSYKGEGSTFKSGKWVSMGSKSDDDYMKAPKSKVMPAGATVKTRTFPPMASARSLWKARKKKA